MATPTLGTINLTEITTAESITNWTGVSLSTDNELFKEGSNSVFGILRNDLEVMYYDDGTARDGTGEHLRIWINFTAFSLLDTEANGGMEAFVFDNTNTDYFTIFGSDTYKGGWFNMVVDMAKFTTVTQANIDRWGIRFNRTGAPRQVDNTWMDYIRYMDGYYATGGTSGDKIDLAGIAAQDDITANAYGIIQVIEGIYFGYGKLQIGNGATTTWFQMDGDVLSFADAPVAANFFEVSGNGSGANLVFTDSLIQSAGTTDDPRFVFDMSDTNITFSMTGCVLQRSAAITFASGQTVTGNTFNNCGLITHAGAVMNNSVVKNYQGTPIAALLYDVNADPDGEMDGMSFTKGSATKHAINFGTTSPLTMTLRDMSFSGYNAVDGNSDSTLYFARTSGEVTLNLIGVTGNVSITTAGCNVTKVINPVSTTITVKDVNTFAAIEGARVYIQPSDNSGDLNYQETCSIVQSAGTATVTHTAHGLATNDKVRIQGCNEVAYNGIHQITVTGANTYTYSIDAGTASPATGSPVSTTVLISGLTNASGVISDTRSFSVNQPITGRVREGSSPSPFYKTSPISDTVDKDNGFSLTVFLIPD